MKLHSLLASQPQTVNLIRVDAPEIRSTKTVSVSTDDKTFREVGKHVFPPSPKPPVPPSPSPSPARWRCIG